MFKKKYISASAVPLWHILYFTGCYVFILVKLDPALLYECQTPPFYWDKIFFNNFLIFPGGLAEYLSILLSQFYYYPWIGAFILTLFLVLTLVLSRIILGHFFPRSKNSILTFIPVILLFIMFTLYEHRLTSTIAWLFSLFFFILYLKLEARPVLVRFPAFLVLALILYYIGAGFLLIFAVLVCLSELLFRRRIYFGLGCIVILLLIPYIARHIFILTVKSSFFYLLLPMYDYRPFFTPYMLCLYFPLVLISIRLGLLDRVFSIFVRLQKNWAPGLALLLTCSGVLVSFDSGMHTILKVDDYARHGQWEKILQFTEKHPSDDVLVAFLTNRALYHTGRLTSDLFVWPQKWGVDGLYLPQEARRFFSLQVSDFYWDMGFLNESHHWAQEDHTNFFYNPRYLQRMALTSILKGNTGLAQMCLNALGKTVLYRKWAQKYRHLLKDPQAAKNNEEFSHLEKTVHEDFIVNPLLPGQDMEFLVAQNIKNKMAFEYLMCDYMLSFRLGKFFDLFHSSGYSRNSYVPRLYQEALAVYLYNTRPENPSDWKGLEKRTIADFNSFMNIIKQHNGDALEARDLLEEKFGHSYWYYSLFNNPAVQEGRPQN
ncbi:hypothetical protein JW935_08520 [candidate division KSB1 bacterium]|nr:hypothetical protein [candidate division KSB1 bacterium]